jgi:hypothetical protein
MPHLLPATYSRAAACSFNGRECGEVLTNLPLARQSSGALFVRRRKIVKNLNDKK